MRPSIREYRGLLESDDSHLKLSITKTNELVVGLGHPNMDDVAEKTAFKNTQSLAAQTKHEIRPRPPFCSWCYGVE